MGTTWRTESVRGFPQLAARFFVADVAQLGHLYRKETQ